VKRLSELHQLAGRVAIVTGGAGHLGLAFGEALAEAGARVVVVDRERAACDQRVAHLEKHGGVGALAITVDLSDPSSPSEIVKRTLEHFGRLDILVNNAAFTGATNVRGFAVPLAEQTLEAWDAALRVNLTSAFLLCQAARLALEASGHGAIVNVGSIYGVVGPDLWLYEGTSMGNPAAYGASKGGLLQLTTYLATVLAPKIRVNALSPGGIERGQPESFRSRYVSRTPLRRMAREQDFKGALLFLASDASEYVTGQNIMVDGGWTSW
jgi:NAD(P)-dependent dehydrogenase (short-subunit alcohol dehydrogenase family)